MLSIRQRLCFVQIGIQIVLMSSLCVLLYYHLEQKQRESFDTQLQDLASSLAVRLQVEREGNDWEIEMEGESEDLLRKHIYYLIADPEGKKTFCSPNLKKTRWQAQTASLKIPDKGKTILPDGRNGRYWMQHTVPVIDGRGNYTKKWMILVASPSEHLEQTLKEIKWGTILGCCATLLLSAFSTYILINQGLRPLNELGKQISAIDSEHLDQSIHLSYTPRELQEMVQKINELLARLEESFTQIKRFASDASHELRTPLAELKIIVQSSQQIIRSTSVNSSQNTSLSQILGINLKDADLVIAKMQRLIESLLCIARKHPILEQNKLQMHSLHQLISPYLTKRLILKNIDQTLCIRIQQELFQALLRNLVENAERYSQGAIEIEWIGKAYGNDGTLTISNDAPELNHQDLEKMQQAFWQKDSSRTTSTHVGLGLNLVKQYCHQHGWKLTLHLKKKRFSACIHAITYLKN